MDYMDIDEVCDIPDTPYRVAEQDINGRWGIGREIDSSVVSHSADRTTNHEEKHFLHSQHTEKGKALCTFQSPTPEENDDMDLTEWSGPAQVLHNGFANGAFRDLQAKELRKGSTYINGSSTLCGIEDSSMTALNTCKGKEMKDDTSKGGSGLDCGKGAFGDSQPKGGNSASSPRVGGEKRFVRYGCISPHNIAKAKQSAENPSNGSMDVQNETETLSDQSLNLVRDLIAEESNFSRKQRVVTHPSSSKELDSENLDSATRSSITHDEETTVPNNGSGDVQGSSEGLQWRGTRNRTKKIIPPLSGDGQHLSKTKDDPCYVNQQNENKVVRRDNWKGSSSRIDNGYNEDQTAVSFQNGSALNEAQSVSHSMSQPVYVSGRPAAAGTLVRRKKQGSASTDHGETSTSASVDSEVVFLGSSGEQLSSKSTRNQSSHGSRTLYPVDEFSPEMRNFGSHNTSFSSSDDTDDRAGQIEADEMLARELQDQLYNEAPGVEDDEFDALLTSMLQREETPHPVYSSRGSSNFFRPSQSSSSQSSSVHRGTSARGPASTRLTRLRSRLPSPLPSISYGESGSIFPPNMDLDMRIHLLEALEAFNDMEMSGNFLEREFNENDYEMLLALDEHNYQHAGATPAQINSLPQSTVQGDNFEEACVICLETPTTGDTIRHLPCLHKFHKDCIDPWLRERKSCPVCKSSII